MYANRFISINLYDQLTEEADFNGNVSSKAIVILTLTAVILFPIAE